MNKTCLIALGIAFALGACVPQSEPAAPGFLGYVYAYEQGELVAGREVGAYRSRTGCVDAVKSAVDAVRHGAPAGASVAGACYPIPDAPPPSTNAQPARAVPDSSI